MLRRVFVRLCAAIAMAHLNGTVDFGGVFGAAPPDDGGTAPRFTGTPAAAGAAAAAAGAADDVTQRVERLERALQASNQALQQLIGQQAPAPARQVGDPAAMNMIDTRSLGKPRDFNGTATEWQEWQFVLKAYAFAVNPMMKHVMESAAALQDQPADHSQMSDEERRTSTQLYYMLVLLCKDRALDSVRNAPEGNGAEAWRRLMWEFEPGVGVRYGAILQGLLRRKFGENSETDLAREIEAFDREVSKYELQSGDKLSDAVKHGILAGGMMNTRLREHIDLNMHRLADYAALRDEVINYSRAKKDWTQLPMAMQVDAIVPATAKGKPKPKAKAKSGDVVTLVKECKECDGRDTPLWWQ